MLSNSDMSRLQGEAASFASFESNPELVKQFVWTRMKQMEAQEKAHIKAALKTPKAAAKVFDAVFEAMQHPTESYIEERLLLALNTRSMLIGRVKTQYEVGPYRLDFAFPDVKLCVEADGKDFHSAPDDISRDQRRTKYLAELGWTVIRFTGSRINKDLYGCIDRITTLYTQMCKDAGLPEPWEVAP